MTKFKKKGFTIVELVIVIAVIAILAAVLIPTFSNIIRRAKVSADVQLCRNLNTVLSNASAEGRIPSSMYDVLYLENEAGYVIENLNPTAEGYYYAWDSEANKILYILDDLETVYFPEDYIVNPSVCWMTAGSAEEMNTLANHGYNIALERDIDVPVELNNVVSVDTLGFTLSSLVMKSGSSNVETATLKGQFGTTTLQTGASNIVTSGTINSLSVQSGSSQVTVGGYVSNYSASEGIISTISSAGMVNTIDEGSKTTITNNGVIIENKGQSVVEGNEASANANENNVVSVATREAIESIRTQVSSGLRNFDGETIKLTADIPMNGIAFSPMSSFYRKNSEDTSTVYDPVTKTYVKPDSAKNWFSGTFDGDGHSIIGLSNNGFSITGLTAGTNDSTPTFGLTEITYNEAIYGLFASVYNATIKNLNVTCSIDMILDNQSKMVGDSVGGIIGFATGDYLVLENCTVNGSIKGFDGVGGLVGRCYAKTATLTNCTNNANITGARKAGGLIGFASGCTITFSNCVNNGRVENLGYKYDKDTLQANDAETKNGTGMYVAASAYSGKKPGGSKYNTTGIDGFENRGIVVIAGKECGYYFLEGDASWTDREGY